MAAMSSMVASRFEVEVVAGRARLGVVNVRRVRRVLRSVWWWLLLFLVEWEKEKWCEGGMKVGRLQELTLKIISAGRDRSPEIEGFVLK